MFHAFHRQQVGEQHAARMRKKKADGATKPKCTPAGVNGSSTATATTVNEQAMSQGLGLLLKGFLRVRMMKVTSTCVAMDSMIQPVWKSVSPAWKTPSMM